MSRQEKLINRLKRKPKNFVWSELEAVLTSLGYKQEHGSGSRRKFIHSQSAVVISLHEPHPAKILKQYQIRDVLNHLKEQGYL